MKNYILQNKCGGYLRIFSYYAKFLVGEAGCLSHMLVRSLSNPKMMSKWSMNRQWLNKNDCINNVIEKFFQSIHQTSTHRVFKVYRLPNMVCNTCFPNCAWRMMVSTVGNLLSVTGPNENNGFSTVLYIFQEDFPRNCS